MDCCNNKKSFISKLRIGVKDKTINKSTQDTLQNKRLILVGNPNVGKSVIFNNLTGIYVTVSNYPGTTVEISKGFCSMGDETYEIIDTPGMYSMLPITDEERVTRRLLLEEKNALIAHVVDAKNLERMLPLTVQLKEAGFPIILVLNMIDEANRRGIKIDSDKLSEILDIPVVVTSAIQNQGISDLKKAIKEYKPDFAKQKYNTQKSNIRDNDNIETALANIESLLTADYGIWKKFIAKLIIQEDCEILELVKKKEKNYEQILDIIKQAQLNHSEPLQYMFALQLKQEVKDILNDVVKIDEKPASEMQQLLDKLTINPLTGIPILFLVLYFGLYKFVGQFGAGTIVDFIEGTIFEGYINPWVNNLVTSTIPYKPLQELIALDYGIVTLGIRYAVAIVLPIVGTFFLVFSIIEDSGYLPRLALLIDKVFKAIGLSGRAVIPMTLGFGCGTMATLVTRTLETKRERVLATLLLALAIPCSAQLGVIMALLSSNPKALLIWLVFVVFVFLFIGYLSSKVIPGESATFFMEVPPLRLPKLSNVIDKTVSRMYWYFIEIMPIFILSSVIIWVGKMTGILDMLITLLTPIMHGLGLPGELAKVFLFGFFRRDYGAAGLYDLQKAGILTGVQVLVASATLTLFIPCIAQLAIMIKERGLKTALAITGFIIPFAFLAGYVLRWILIASKVVF